MTSIELVSSKKFQAHKQAVVDLVVLNANLLASSGLDDSIRIWDISSAEEVDTLEYPTGWCGGLTRTSDGKLVVAYINERMKIWDPSSRQVAIWDAIEHERFSKVTTLRDGRIVAAEDGGNVSIINPDKGTLEVKLECYDDLVGYRGDIWVGGLSELKDGRLATSCDCFDDTFLWDLAVVEDAKKLAEQFGIVQGLTLLPRGLVAGHDKHENFIALKQQAKPLPDRLHAPRVSEFVALDNGEIAAVEQQNHIGIYEAVGRTKRIDKRAHDENIAAVTKCSSGLLATACIGNSVRIWDVSTFEELARYKLEARATCLSVLPTGELMAGDDRGQIHVLGVH